MTQPLSQPVHLRSVLVKGNNKKMGYGPVLCGAKEPCTTRSTETYRKYKSRYFCTMCAECLLLLDWEILANLDI